MYRTKGSTMVKYLVALALPLLAACSSAATVAKDVETGTQLVVDAANQAWLDASNACVAASTNGVDVLGCSAPLEKAHTVLLQVNADMAQGTADVCALQPIVPAL